MKVFAAFVVSASTAAAFAPVTSISRCTSRILVDVLDCVVEDSCGHRRAPTMGGVTDYSTQEDDYVGDRVQTPLSKLEQSGWVGRDLLPASGLNAPELIHLRAG